MRTVLAVLALLLLAADARAVEVAGVKLDPAVSIGGKTLTLNGYGIRRKFFVKVYVGALYTERRVRSADEIRRDPGGKLIRMGFVHGKVERKKIVDAFSEGLANNAPEVASSEEARRFLSLFAADFLRGDVVDLFLGPDGTVTVRHNGRTLGTIRSESLARAIPLVYVGPKPAEESLKKGMLGLE